MQVVAVAADLVVIGLTMVQAVLVVAVTVGVVVVAILLLQEEEEPEVMGQVVFKVLVRLLMVALLVLIDFL